MKFNIILFLLLFISSTVQSQDSKFQTGIIVGNHFSFANFDYDMNLDNEPLLRYSAGILMRYKFKTDWKFQGLPWSPPVRKGVWALDFGANAVFTGYDYGLPNLGTFQDQLMIEFPVMLALWDERSVLIKKKLLRQGKTLHARIGLKPSILLKNDVEKTINEGSNFLTEQTKFGGFNLMASYGMGMIYNTKKQNSMSLEINFNVGFIKTTQGTIRYRVDNGTIQTVDFNSFGHYIAIKTIYLFKSDIYRRVPSKIIYSPRLISNNN
jgi:hypothetical protein